MAKRGDNYTPMGKKIYALAKNQAELADILKLTQQSVSGKLNGKIATSIEDLETLSQYYRCPVIYFFLPLNVSVAQSELILQMLSGFHENLMAALNALASRPEYVQTYVAEMAVKGMALYDQGQKDSLGDDTGS
jgi:transcriptional regulator with XRE-family HTH domain